MKGYLVAVFLFSWTCSSAQLLSTAPDGSCSRARLMLSLDDAKGASDQLMTLDKDFVDGKALFAEGYYRGALQKFMDYATDNPASPLAGIARAGVADCLFALGDYHAALGKYLALDYPALMPAEKAVVDFRSGVCAYHTGDIALAESKLTSALSEPSIRSDARFFLGVIAFDKGDYAKSQSYFQLVNTMAEPGSRAPYYLVQIDFAQGHYTKALAGARNLLRHADGVEVPEMLRIIGESLCHLDNRSQGVEELRRYLKLCPEPLPSALYYVGLDDYEDGDYTEALAKLNIVARDASGALQQSAYLYIGQSLMQQGESASALLAFDKAASVAFDPAVREAAYYNYAVAKLEGGTVPFKSSAQTLEDFLRQYPTGSYSERVATCLAEGYIADKDYQLALERIENVGGSSPRLQKAKQRVLYCLALQDLQRNEIENASAYIDRASAIKNGDSNLQAEISLVKARVLAAQGNNANAVDYFRRYLNMASKTAENRSVAEYGLAYALYGTGKRAESEKAFRELIGKFDRQELKADIYNRLGDLRYSGNDFTEAADFYSRAYEVYRAGGDAPLLNHARMLGNLRDYQGKLKALELFRRQYPNSLLTADALMETSQAQISLGRNEDAVATYRTVIDSYGGTETGRKAYLQLAMTLLDKGLRKDAVDTYRSLISVYPSSEEARQAATLLKYLSVEDGTGGEYLAFMRSVENAPEIDVAEAENISYDSAVKRFRNRHDIAALEDFMSEYPQSGRNADVLGMLLNDASISGDKDRALELATKILERYPDSRAVEPAMEVNAQALYDSDRLPEALQAWEALEKRTSDLERATTARLGAMRAARDMGDNDTALSKAEDILDSAVTGDPVDEARFVKACMIEAEGNAQKAIDIWHTLSSRTESVFGVKSAYHEAEALYTLGRNAKALKAVQALVQSGSPHRYWVARGFILMSDIYKAQGKDFEAREYLEALRDNYPGKETDIIMMIDSRLNPSND